MSGTGAVMRVDTKMKTVSATVPLDVKAEVTAVLASRGISMSALIRELLVRVAAGDKEALAWLDDARRNYRQGHQDEGCCA